MSQTLGLARGPPTHPDQMQVVDSRGGVESPLTLEAEVADVAINSEDATIPGVMLTDQVSDPAQPSAGYTIVYTKAGVIYVRSTLGIWQPLVNPMEQAADLIVGGTAGALTRLAKGSDSQVLTVDPVTHLLTWADLPASSGGFTEGVKLSKSGVQTLNNAVETDVTFDTEAFDTDTMHDGVTNPERITFTTAGKYIVGAHVTFSNAFTTGLRIITIYDHNSNQQGGLYLNAAAGFTTLSTTALISASAGNWAKLSAFQSRGGTLDVTSALFWAWRVG